MKSDTYISFLSNKINTKKKEKKTKPKYKSSPQTLVAVESFCEVDQHVFECRDCRQLGCSIHLTADLCDNCRLCGFYEYYGNHGDETPRPKHATFGPRLQCGNCGRGGCASHFPDDFDEDEDRCLDCQSNHP
jgi:hypothetical protein